MRVLGIDPGYDRVGVAVLEYENGSEVLVHSSCVETDKNDDLTDRLFYIGNSIEEIIRTHKPDTLAIETLFFNTNQKTAIGVAQARGIIMFAAMKHGCTIHEFGPQEIKVAITGYGKSDKAAVTSMVKQLVRGAPESALDDEFDAIAIGITCLAHHGRGG